MVLEHRMRTLNYMAGDPFLLRLGRRFKDYPTLADNTAENGWRLGKARSGLSFAGTLNIFVR